MTVMSLPLQVIHPNGLISEITSLSDNGVVLFILYAFMLQPAVTLSTNTYTDRRSLCFINFVNQERVSAASALINTAARNEVSLAVKQPRQLLAQQPSSEGVQAQM
ncbi:UNKNOWN [Stylonychia lemnae]|uniref:Uncharacterized protein n=1 Tax=Stylonychia lemnae TaxID=5949 RepID=A0A077ZWA6_STYLE|nr:UNKNOWN [Stylonychia lemnae]|eukprot:CDW74154.1 UNKNOWN [Stylonychia lemnae]